MFKKTKSISINVLSAFVILICLCLGVVNSANAWFTDKHEQGVQIVVEVGDLKLNVYQNSIATANKLSTDADNLENNTANYISLSGEIKPDEKVGLILWLSNDDKGSASMFVRYKLEVYVRGITDDTLLSGIELQSYTAPSSTANGFVKNTSDGYYYYQNNAGTNTLFKKGDSAKMMETFSVPYSAFIDANGNLKYINSDTIYIKVIVEASISSAFV